MCCSESGVPACSPGPGADSWPRCCCTTTSRDWITSCEIGTRVSNGQHPEDVEADKQRVERVLEEGLEKVDSARAAHAVVARVERLSHGHTEAELGQQAAQEVP